MHKLLLSCTGCPLVSRSVDTLVALGYEAETVAIWVAYNELVGTPRRESKGLNHRCISTASLPEDLDLVHLEVCDVVGAQPDKVRLLSDAEELSIEVVRLPPGGLVESPWAEAEDILIEARDRVRSATTIVMPWSFIRPAATTS